MISVLLGVLLFVYGSLAPGMALAWVLLRDPEPEVLLTLGATLGIFALPTLHFVLAILLGSHISTGSIVAVATAILGATYALHKRRLH